MVRPRAGDAMTWPLAAAPWVAISVWAVARGYWDDDCDWVDADVWRDEGLWTDA